MANDALLGSNFRVYIEGALCAVSSINLTYTINDIPELDISLPATDPIVNALKPRARIDLIYKDDTYSPPRFVVLFQGEITYFSFIRTTSSRSFNIRAVHETNVLKNTPIFLLSAEEVQSSMIRGDDIYQNYSTQIKGSVFELFSPQNIQSTLDALGKPYTFPKGKKSFTFDIYDYVRAALQFYKEASLQSFTSAGYDFRKLSKSDFNDLFFYPSEGTELEWDSFFQDLVLLYYEKILGNIGGELNYFEAMRQLLAIIIHELIVYPCPLKRSHTFLVKPIMSFSPIPRCNVVYPIFNSNYSINFTHEGRPTRLIQYVNPPFIKNADELVEYFRVIAPEELDAKYQTYKDMVSKVKDKKSARDALGTPEKPFSLTTEEEEARGIVMTTTNIPGHLTAAISLLYKGNSQIKLGNSNRIIYTSTPVRELADKNSMGGIITAGKTAIRLAIYNKMLTDFEAKGITRVSNDEEAKIRLDNEVKAAPSKETINMIDEPDSFVPKQFIIISYANSNLYSKPVFRPHYRVEVSTLSTGTKVPMIRKMKRRYYCLFDRKVDFKKTIHFKDLAGQVINKDSIIYFKDETDQNSVRAQNIGSFVSRVTNINGELDVNTTLKAMTGLSENAVVIDIDPKALVLSGTRELVGKLIALIAKVCEPEIKLGDSRSLANTIISYDELGITANTIYARIDQNIIKNIRTEVARQITAIEKEFISLTKDTEQTVGYEKALENLSKNFEYKGNILDDIRKEKDQFQMPEVEGNIEKIDLVAAGDITRKYTKPLANFYYYYNRYASSSRQVNMLFNPYIMPGFSGIILDSLNVDNPIHTIGYVTSVTHSIDVSNVGTSVGFSVARYVGHLLDTPLDIKKEIDSSYGADTFLLDLIKNRDTNVKVKYKTLYDTIAQMPFYGGEWKGPKLEKTLTELLGPMGNGSYPQTVRLSELSTYIEPKNIKDAYSLIRRPIQTVKTGNESIDNIYYKEAPSNVTFIYNSGNVGYDFPDRIEIQGEQLNIELSNYVLAHTFHCRNREGLIGGLTNAL